VADYIVCWDSFERFLADQIKYSEGGSDIYFASESIATNDEEPVSAQRDRLRGQALQWRTGSVPVDERKARPVKIGRCSRDPARRLQEVQVGNYRPLFDVCVIPCMTQYWWKGNSIAHSRRTVSVESGTRFHRAFIR
jgi:hypothetical protein